MEYTKLQQLLLRWYFDQKRELPWRKTTDPYRVWLSEIILQQTRVNQGLPYYERFISNYPSVHALAAADEDRVLKDWEGLGYYSRARNLHHTAKFVSEERSGKFPEDYDGLLKLKGVGEYTAAAIASFAYNEEKAVVDGNVFRFLSRLHADDTPINSNKGKKHFAQLARLFLNRENPALHNQAIMEFGALHCLPKNPHCDSCPFNMHCGAYINKEVARLPVKNKVGSKRVRYFTYLFMEYEGQSIIEKRREGIWQGLFQFPLIERSNLLSLKNLLDDTEFKEWLQNDFEITSQNVLKPHQLSHQSLHIQVLGLSLSRKIVLPKGYKWVQVQALEELAFPRPLRQYLDEKQLNLPPF